MSKRSRLATLMALQYGVQGSFWPLLTLHLRDLGIGERHRGWIFATYAVGATVTSLGFGQLVDRVWSSQYVIAAVYAIGACFLAAIAAGVATDPVPLFAIFLAYWLFTAPTYGLSVSLVLRNLDEPKRDFGGVRLWGTVGWMCAGWLVSATMVWVDGTPHTGIHVAFWIAAALSAGVSAWSLTLPNTPPLAVGARAKFGARSLVNLLATNHLAAFLLVSMGFYLCNPFIYQLIPPYLESEGMAKPRIPTAMSLGQIPEIAGLFLLPFLFRRLGEVGTLRLGLFAWFARFGILALGPPLWLAVATIPLQGVGVACFMVGGQVYVDRRAPAHLRASAQTLLFFLSSGIASLCGGVVAGEIASRSGDEWAIVFVIPCVVNLLLLLYFRAGIETGLVRDETPGRDVLSVEARPVAVLGPVSRGCLATEPADG